MDLEKIGPLLKEVRTSLNMTLEDFYSPITKHYSNCSSIENGKRKIGKRLSKDIIEYYNINPEFLTNGTEPKILQVRSYNRKRIPTRSSSLSPNRVPFYDINIIDLNPSLPNLFNENIPEYYVDYRPFNDCTAYLPIYGDSMYPDYVSGEIIAIKEIINLEIILWGEAHLVITNELANNINTVKLLFEHPDPDKLILRAANPNFKGDTIISKKAVVKIYIIKGKITRNQL